MTKYIHHPARLACAAFALWIYGMLALTTERAWSQASSATFYGTVTDPTGAVVPDAKVTLIEQGTQATMTKTTSTSGDFAFSFVPDIFGANITPNMTKRANN